MLQRQRQRHLALQAPSEQQLQIFVVSHRPMRIEVALGRLAKSPFVVGNKVRSERVAACVSMP
jgi:hypothetical protein